MTVFKNTDAAVIDVPDVLSNPFEHGLWHHGGACGEIEDAGGSGGHVWVTPMNSNERED
jgi:hypothetical protein